VAAILLVRDQLPSRRSYLLPDAAAVLPWLAAGCLELHALVPLVGGARVVSAPLFFLAAWLLPPRESALVVLITAAWTAVFPVGRLSHVLAGTLFDAAAFVPFGILFRKWFPYPLGMLQLMSRRRNGAGAGIAGARRTGQPALRDNAGQAAFPTDHLDHLRNIADPSDGIRRVVEGVHPASGAELVFFAQGNPPKVVVSSPRESVLIRGDEIPEALKGPSSEVFLTRRTIRSTGPDSSVLVPVTSGSGIVGILGAIRPGGAEWSDPVVPMLEQGAFFIGRELDLRSGIEGVYWEVSRADGIYRLVSQIGGVAERSREEGTSETNRRIELYRITAENVRSHLDARRVLLARVDLNDKAGSILWDAREDGSHGRTDEVTPLGDSYIEWVARKGECRLVEERSGLHALPGAWREGGDGSCFLLPFPMPDGFRGVMACISRTGEDALVKRDIMRGEQFLTVMRMGISHAEEVERLANEAQTDGLTGLLNRKTFCARLDNVLERLDRRRPCAVIMLDIDHFKRINDGYGHPAGDEVIRTVSDVIQRTVRKGDFAGRYGGEEFVLYLEDVDDAQAVQAAERLRSLVRNVKYCFSGKEIVVTVSMGLACYPQHGISGDPLLRCADEALYRSKSAGRDRVTIHEERA
jgi:diguanylate cyclase (GGDEF)-like protein